MADTSQTVTALERRPVLDQDNVQLTTATATVVSPDPSYVEIVDNAGAFEAVFHKAGEIIVVATNLASSETSHIDTTIDPAPFAVHYGDPI